MDVLLFLPGGMIMDRFGRWWVSIPIMICLGIGFFLLPLTSTYPTIAAAACLLGLANGLSSGIVMTLGSDACPVFGRSQFLAGWRLLTDTGGTLGPLTITASP